MLTTTLNEIRRKSPCKEGWEILLTNLGKTKADDDPVEVMTVLESNGMDDALWVVDKCINPYICRLFAADCAERVLHIFEAEHPNDSRPRAAINLARDRNASDAAWSAASDAADAAAWSAARDAARSAADAAAWSAASDAAWSAASDAADAAAWSAARDAADAARSAASDAARSAQIERLKQYLTHGEAAKDMDWNKW